MTDLMDELTDEVIVTDPALFADEVPDFDTPEIPIPVTVSDGETTCPVCGQDDFKTTGGLRRHLTRMHDAGPAKDAKPRTTRKAAKSDLAHDLRNMFGIVGMAVSAANQYDGRVIVMNAESMANAWAELAKQNETVDRVLRGAVAGSAFGAVAMSMVPVVVAILANHGAMDPMIAQMVGAPPIEHDS